MEKSVYFDKYKKKIECAVIIVTHNSELYIEKCMQSLESQTVAPTRIVIVDSHSITTDYLLKLKKDPKIHLRLVKENIGFCRGNNLGMTYVPAEVNYVLFLNPDTFLPPDFIVKAIDQMERTDASKVGILTGIMLGYDIQKKQPTGVIDSTGIFRKWYGKWYDRDQGQQYSPKKYTQPEYLPAVCGALMFCRKTALDQVGLTNCYEIFDPSFYMYKEDIDLSLRIRKKGWTLVLNPLLIAYHCRGWNKQRKLVSHSLRLLSAKNELCLTIRYRSPYILYSLIKYFLVKNFNF